MSTLPFAPAAERNRQAIQEVLVKVLGDEGRVLEIGAGTGQHAVAFSAAFPGLSWLPTDYGPAFPGLQQRVGEAGVPNLEVPVSLDVSTGPWPSGPFAAAFSANTAHIMPQTVVDAMFGGVASILSAGAPFLLYGPFRFKGSFTTVSNAQFDARLRAMDAQQGIRDATRLESVGGRLHLKLEQVIDMPANNHVLLFRKQA